ncbi:MAG: VOC family protein [Chloroflexi bacterium]|nr:VOC family protein [Chloroflexota bacterium]
MTISAQSEALVSQRIHPATRLGHVHYTAANLDRQIAFYEKVLGFKLHWREGNAAGLGAGKEDLLRLTEQPDARRVRGTTGLYHTAFLVPARWDLAQLLKSIAETRTRIQGMSDHGTHHAIYLPDAEGNGIELAWDRPQAQWPRTLAEMMQRNRGLSPEEVFSALEENTAPWEGLNAETKVGHVHLHVSQLPATEHFYREVLGFDIPMDMRMDTALFFSAGGYHHHIGTNVWQGVGAPPPPADAIGLRYFSVVVPDGAELERVVTRVRQAGIDAERARDGFLVRDPAANGIVLTTPAAG